MRLESSGLADAPFHDSSETRPGAGGVRNIYVLAARLGRANTAIDVATIGCEEACAGMRAQSAAVALRASGRLRIVASSGPRDEPTVRIDLSDATLGASDAMAEALERPEPTWCANETELELRYPRLADGWRARGIRAWGAVPFGTGPEGSGVLALAFDESRSLELAEREWLGAVAELTAQALERVRLVELLRASEARRSALGDDEQKRSAETLESLGSTFAGELDHGKLVQLVTDEVTRLLGADLGAFAEAADRTSFTLYPITTENLERLRELRRPRAARLLTATLAEQRIVRVADVLADPRYTGEGLSRDTSSALRSYLAVPVVARTGYLFGALLFGHAEVDRFGDEHERLAVSAARKAAVALENARAYRTVREQREELEAALERVRLSDSRKDEFLAVLGHELRNPLAPIATALDLMELKDSGAFAKERDVIRRQVQHLTRLLEDLLDVSRITRKKLQLSKRVIEIGGALTKAAEMTSPLLQKRRQRLLLDVPKSGALVEADPTRLAQVFENLLTNASKYSDPGTEISVSAKVEGEQVRVTVRDQGVGIAPELMPRLFEWYVQGERSLDRAEGGLGIGLALAKSLAELHGGSIDAYSDGPGRGSTFSVLLPRAIGEHGAERTRPSAPLHPKNGGKRVLIVDDNVDAARMLEELLSAIGHDVRMAHDPRAALEVAAAFDPEVAVLDIGLPVMDGYELARELRARTRSAELRLIAVTGYGQDHDRARAREAGFHHHLVKPIELDALVRLLDEEAA